jgi:hypothetical protein
MIPARVKDAFWGTVRDCLIRLHGLTPGAAQELCAQYRREVESRPRGLAQNIFYHNEPFDVACDLSGRELDFAAHREEYERIAEENHQGLRKARSASPPTDVPPLRREAQ